MNDISDVQQNGQRNFGARRKIFRSNEAEFFFLNNAYLNAYIQLLKGIRQHGGLFLLTGEAGMGKTFLLRKLEKEAPTNIKLVFCYSTNLDYENLIAVICDQLGVGTTEHHLSNRIAAFKEYLKTNSEQGMTLALLIDDAHHLGQDVLDNLIASFSLELHNDCALRIVLSGIPILEEILKRIGIVHRLAMTILQIRLEPMSSTDVATYISRQIKRAGILDVDSLFSPLAIQKITRYTGGIPRLINTLCERALLITQLDEETTVSIASIDETANELMLKEHEVIADGIMTNAFDEIHLNDKTQHLNSSRPMAPGANHLGNDTKKIFSESFLMDKPDVDLDETINESIFQNIIDYPITAISFSASHLDSANQFVHSTTPTVQSEYGNTEVIRNNLIENILRDEFRENTIMTTQWDDFKIEQKRPRFFESPKLQFLSLLFFAILAGLLGGVGSIYLFRETPVPIPIVSPAPVLETSGQASVSMQQAPIPASIHDRDGGLDSNQVSNRTSVAESSVSPASTSSPPGVSASGSVEPVQTSQPETSVNPVLTSLSPSVAELKPPVEPATISVTDSSRAGLESSPVSAPATITPPVAESETLPASQPSAGETTSETPLISSYMSSGDAFMARGDVASARLFYLEAANIGFPAGMAAVGKTYDPVVLSRLRIKGFLADPDKAVEWYIKAEKAGHAETAEYLQELQGWMAGSSP